MASRWMRGGLIVGVLSLLGYGLYRLVGFASLAWAIAHPRSQDLPLPDGLVALGSARGQALLAQADSRVDLDALQGVFEAQQYGSYCGVASSVMALRALGMGPVSQDSFFEGTEVAGHSAWSTFFGGMTLDQLGALLGARGARVEVVHAADSDVAAFRRLARANLGRSGDVMLVNYLRKRLEQRTGGHISPVAAYHAPSDRFLVLDVSTYKYPPVWVEAAELYGAMNTVDGSVQLTRGYVEVARPL